jgi:drug/metabolite transporter, DME family
MAVVSNHNVTSKDHAHLKGVGFVLLAGVFWSTAGIIVRLIESADEWQIVFYRSVALMLTLLVVLVARNGRTIFSTFRTAGVNAIVGGLCLGSGFACWIFSLTHTTVANALFLLSTAPFLTAILARIVIGERVVRATWLAMTVALVGVAIMVAEGTVVGTLFGNVMGLAAALAFSGFTVALRRGKEVDMLPTVCLAGTFAAIIAGTVLLATGIGFVVSGYDLSLCATLGVGQIGCGLILFTIGSRYVPAAELALLSLTEVVLGPVWVWVGVGEVPTVWTFLGGVIVLVAVAGRALLGVRRRPPIGVV